MQRSAARVPRDGLDRRRRDRVHRASARRKVTPCASASQRGQRRNRVAQFDPQLVRAPQHRRADRRRASIGQRAAGARWREQLAAVAHLGAQECLEDGHAPPAAAPPRPGRDARRGCRRPAPSRPRRRASAWRRCQHWPCCWPVTVTKPKLRIEAPFACASRSITTTRLPEPRRRQRMGEPQMPAPTTARSNGPATAALIV